MAPPKAILFDVGGVVVLSPFQAILDYEIENRIPLGYINHAIQRGPPDTGAWQLIERGAQPLDDAWFAAFQAQLSQPDVWRAYWVRWSARGGGHADTGTTSALGDHVPPVPDVAAKTLFWRMMRYSRRPDPCMYPALKRLREEGRGKWIVGALSNTVHFPTGILDDEGVVFDKSILFPEMPEYEGDSTDVADWFDIYLSSAHIGVRKPDPEAYRLSVRELSRVAEAKGLGKVEPGDVLFLDDIGVNLKFAREVGLRTIKVDLGGTREAVGMLEREVGVKLVEGRSRL
ncbi:epoxide hydrolase-like protein [Karstenula rhodostoma CBS 690.94]|uniref:Epoxide hydrolase-like protein n=1 Tax=Karstenula rhodostoma CBS 690.94 TaxID=1392251 RepID=A0A9P4Q059_9PLEO|nr:epoxide hydrolase-like protein [Karstenula rhodostoma CBS 690.94]